MDIRTSLWNSRERAAPEPVGLAASSVPWHLRELCGPQYRSLDMGWRTRMTKRAEASFSIELLPLRWTLFHRAGRRLRAPDHHKPRIA